MAQWERLGYYLFFSTHRVIKNKIQLILVNEQGDPFSLTRPTIITKPEVEVQTNKTYFSYVLTGTEKGFEETFGTTCHGAVRLFLIKFLPLKFC